MKNKYWEHLSVHSQYNYPYCVLFIVVQADDACSSAFLPVGVQIL